MGAQNNSKNSWQHPIPNFLLASYKNEIDISDIIDLEADSLLQTLRKNHPKSFSAEILYTPVEEIAHLLNVDLRTSRHSRALGTTKATVGKIQVTINAENQHYFRRRFTLAHELGHIYLSQLAGPFTFQELSNTKNSNNEEEFLCDLFASAILMPKSSLEQYLEGDKGITLSTVNRIATDFKVSKSAVLRRLACIKKALLLFWSEIENPLTEGSEKAERITLVYPNLYQLSHHFIPLYCTANDTRFDPNLIAESLEKEISLSGNVRIRDLGSLPEGNYRIHNIFFSRGSKKLPYSEQIKKTQQLYDMSTLIELNTSM